MDKQTYIERHPQSMLAEQIRQDWARIPDDADIRIISGIVAPATPQSKLYKTLRASRRGQYLVGGRAGRHKNDGNWIAVY